MRTLYGAHVNIWPIILCVFITQGPECFFFFVISYATKNDKVHVVFLLFILVPSFSLSFLFFYFLMEL